MFIMVLRSTLVIYYAMLLIFPLRTSSTSYCNKFYR